MTRFWWLRHGPTHAKHFCGWLDLSADLSDHAAIGRMQALLPDAPVVSSDLLRARQTADAIAGPRPRLPALPNLREFHFGEWEGKEWSETAESHPELSRAYWESPGDIAPPGGESWNAAAARVDAAVGGLLALGHTDLIVVAHMGVILTRLAQALDEDPETAIGHRIDPLSLTRLAHDGTRWRAELINHIP